MAAQADPNPGSDWETSLLPRNVIGCYNGFHAAHEAGCEANTSKSMSRQQIMSKITSDYEAALPTELSLAEAAALDVGRKEAAAARRRGATSTSPRMGLTLYFLDKENSCNLSPTNYRRSRTAAVDHACKVRPNPSYPGTNLVFQLCCN